MLLKLVKTYCLPRLPYGCEIWPREAIDMKEINVMWIVLDTLLIAAGEKVLNRCNILSVSAVVIFD